MYFSVLSVSPEALSLIRELIIQPSVEDRKLVLWGRRIAMELVGILVPISLEWFSIPAWGVGDPGFKSQRPHHT